MGEKHFLKKIKLKNVLFNPVRKNRKGVRRVNDVFQVGS